MTLDTIINQPFNGVVFVKRRDEIIFEKAYGYADLANKRVNQSNTRFPTASAGKVFVATCILQLIEQGKLNFDDTIKHILSIDLKDIDPDITIAQLLNHTSGIPDYFDESIMSDYQELWENYPNYKIRTSKDLLPLFINKKMMYPKGERFQYNNSGYVILGLIIEEITNISFDEYLKHAIFEPCEMVNTGYFELDRLPENCANAYVFDNHNDEYYSNIYSVDVKGSGAGGAYTTIKDIDKFWVSLFNGKLISMEMLENMLKVQTNEEKTHYGYGLWLLRKNEKEYVPYFMGSDPGVSFYSSYDYHDQLEITIINNFEEDVWSIAREIRKQLTIRNVK